MTVARPLKIVLVEDNQDLCESWVELLELEGHQVKTFLDGSSLLQEREALLWCDVLVTDYYLPDVNGIELIGQARQLRGALPAILLSGVRDRSVIDLLHKLQHSIYLPKPADPDDLLAALGSLAARAGGPAQGVVTSD